MVGIEQNITSLVKATNTGPATERRSAQSGEANNDASVNPAESARETFGSRAEVRRAKQHKANKDEKTGSWGQF